MIVRGASSLVPWEVPVFPYPYVGCCHTLAAAGQPPPQSRLRSQRQLLLRAPGQANSVSLSPTEAYKAALAPFGAAKAQPGDLTDADKFALGIGMADAARDCIALSSICPDSPRTKGFIALSELCIFGEQYEPALRHPW